MSIVDKILLYFNHTTNGRYGIINKTSREELLAQHPPTISQPALGNEVNWRLAMILMYAWSTYIKIMVFHLFRPCIHQNHCFYLIEHIFFYRWGQKNHHANKNPEFVIKGVHKQPD